MLSCIAPASWCWTNFRGCATKSKNLPQISGVMAKKMKILTLLLISLFSAVVSAEKIMGVEPPACVGVAAKTVNDAKCIAFFYGQFISVVGAFGKEWNVRPVNNDGVWYIYPTKPNSFVTLDTVLYKISANTGKISQFLPGP